jgi:hypothetical protein
LTQLEGADRVSTDVNPDPPAKPGVSPAVIAAGAVAVLALVGFLGYQALTPKIYAPPMPANYKPDPAAQAFKTWAQQKYRESGGDWTKLSPEDQKKFMDAGRGKGQSLFESFKS